MSEDVESLREKKLASGKVVTTKTSTGQTVSYSATDEEFKASVKAQ